MKKILKALLLAILALSLSVLSGCASSEAPATPPPEVLHPDGESAEQAGTTAEMMEGAVSVRIGHDGQIDWQVDMVDNAAVHTMLNYLSAAPLLFPTYTYEEDPGFVAQRIQGSYSRDDEVLTQNVRAGDLFLFSGNQLRLYFKDVEGANITATPVGHLRETDEGNVTENVIHAYTSNQGDVWGVDVYFIITKVIA